MSQNSDSSSLHVITENGEQCFVWRHNQLTYIAQDKRELPLVFGLKFGNLATKLDLSYNTLASYQNINLFTNLNELILDNNCLEDDHLDFKQNLRLKILSLNKNKLSNLYRLISTIKMCFPNLEYLSLIGNPLCPSPISSSFTSEHLATRESAYSSNESHAICGGAGSENTQQFVASTKSAAPGSRFTVTTAQLVDEKFSDFASQKYRYFIIYHLPNLHFLDSSPITNQERNEALRHCYWMDNHTFGTLDNGYHQQASANLRCQAGTQNGHTNNNNSYDIAAQDPPAVQQPAGSYQLEIIQQTTSSDAPIGQPRGAFSRLSYKYTGKNSEGNRFIRNNDL